MSKKIAIIGASTNKEKYGNKAVRAYKKAGWKVYPVNPHAKEVEGLKSFPSIKDVPETVDTVSLYIPSHISIGLVEDLKEHGVKEAYVNPGAESKELIAALKNVGIQIIQACSISSIGEEASLF